MIFMSVKYVPGQALRGASGTSLGRLLFRRGKQLWMNLFSNQPVSEICFNTRQKVLFVSFPHRARCVVGL